MITLFPCFLSNKNLGTGLLPRSLLSLPLAYLFPKSPRTLHFSEECLGPWMRQVFDFPVGLCTCRFLCLPEISPFLARVHDEAAFPLFCLLWPELLDSTGRFFIRRLYYTFVNKISNFHTGKQINSFFKTNRLTIKALHIGLFRPAVRHTVWDDFINLFTSILSVKVAP